MARVVEAVAAEYGNRLNWEIIVTKELEGAKRYESFSKFLGRPAPVPCIVIEDELAFETTPSTEALKNYLNRIMGN